MNRKIGTVVVVVLVLFGLTACGGGGGGGGGGAADNPAPQALNIVYTRDGDVFVQREDGTGLRNLTNSVESERFQALVGNRVVFSRDVPTGSPPNTVLVTQLFAVDLDGSGLTPLTSGNASNNFIGMVGNRVIFSRTFLVNGRNQRDLFAVNLDGSGFAILANSPDHESIETQGGNIAVLGNRVFFSRTSLTTSNVDLFSVNLDGSGVVPLGNSAGYDLFSGIAGDRVIYKSGSGPFALVSINADGSGLIRLADDGVLINENAGGRVFFLRFVPTAGGSQLDILAINPDGTGLVPVVASNDSEMLHAVVGNRVFFTRGVSVGGGGSRDQLFVANIDGSGVQQLTSSDTVGKRFRALVGNRAIFEQWHDSVGRVRDIVGVNLDGSGLTPLAADGINEHHVRVIVGDRVIIERKFAGSSQKDLLSIRADGTGLVRPAENSASQFVDSVVNNRLVILRRVPDTDGVGTQGDILLVNPDGTNLVPFATSASDELFGAAF